MSTQPRLLAGLSEELHAIADTLESAERGWQRSTRSLRDELEDLVVEQCIVTIQCSDGHRFTGTIDEVGIDHLQLADDGAHRLIALFHVALIKNDHVAFAHAILT